MYVLGIETSCDETAASVVKDGREVLSNVISSSLSFHKQYGGVIPEIAFRKQLETITQVVNSALSEAKVGVEKVELISVTANPGLLGSLLVGVSFAKALGIAQGIPLLEIDHLYGHIYANFLSKVKFKFPCVALIVSGGHTSIFLMKDFDKIEILGSTLDDACGEAFDKVAKILELGYPGGPFIERLARRGRPLIKFRCSVTKQPLDFSFSGIKTAVLYYVRSHRQGKISYKSKCDIAASFQSSVIKALVEKSLLACKVKKIKTLLIGGGVAANNSLRQAFLNAAAHAKIAVYFPPHVLCMDNAAMIAGLGYRLFKKGWKGDKYAD